MAATLCYLDNNATTRPHPQVVEAMVPFLADYWGNPSSVHRFGQRARAAIEEARASVAAAVGCRDREITFTGGGTEASNTAIRGLLATRQRRNPGLTKIITSAVEHAATKETVAAVASTGVEVVAIPVDTLGRLDVNALADALDDTVALASFIWANNETGVIFPIERIAGLCREKGVPLHVDATQAVGKLPVDVSAIGCDCATLAAHKFHGPKGIGALYVRRGVRIDPLIVGGPQERERRGGTENVPGIVGMGKAATLVPQFLEAMPRVAALRDDLEQRVLTAVADAQVNGDLEHRLPNTSNIGFPALGAEAILLMLSEQGICASAGAACSSGSLEPSHVLKAMQISEPLAHGSLRFSLSSQSGPADLERLMEVLPGVIERLKQVMPVGER